MVWRYITAIYQQNTNIEKNLYRASLKFFKFSHKNPWYFFQYFVGTSYTLLVQMTCLSAYMYRQNEKHYWGEIAPPPPPLATLVLKRHTNVPYRTLEKLGIIYT